MKKSKIYLGVIIAFLLITSCVKKELIANVDMSAKVNSWLMKQKTSKNSDKNIDILSENLDYSNFKIHKEINKCDLLIVSIKENLKSAKKLRHNSTLKLLLTLDKSGEIISANIVYYVPTKPETNDDLLLPEAIPNIFANKPVLNEGMFNFLSITGKLLYKFQYKNGNLYSDGFIKTKTENDNHTQLSTCMDWYLITTYYYSDGSSSQTSEYLGRTCNNNECGSLDYMNLLCQSNDIGGGGSSGNGDPDETPITTTEYVTETDTENETNSGDGEESASGPSNLTSFDIIQYNHKAELSYTTYFTGYTTLDEVHMYNTNIDNPQSSCISAEGYAGIRKLTTLAHSNTYQRLVSPFVKLYWNCDVNALFLYLNGGLVRSRQWFHSYSSIH
jgi:hypothetical protein